MVAQDFGGVNSYSASGPLGEFSRDCAYGPRWRDLSSLNKLLGSVWVNASAVVGDGPCQVKNWADLHARHARMRDPDSYGGPLR